MYFLSIFTFQIIAAEWLDIGSSLRFIAAAWPLFCCLLEGWLTKLDIDADAALFVAFDVL